MKVSGFPAFAAALLMCGSAAFSAYAQADTQQAESSAAESVSAAEDLSSEENLTMAPVSVQLEVGEIENQRFDVFLNIDTQIPIAQADITIEYDSDMLELKSSEMNSEEIGGIYLEDSQEGSYIFKYMNTKGSDFCGTYTTLTFRVKDPDLMSTVIYLTVDSLEDVDLMPLSNVIGNGIVSNRKAIDANAEISPDSVYQISLPMSETAVTLESLGIDDAESVTVTDGEKALVQDGLLSTLSEGETDLTVLHSDGTQSVYHLTIFDQEQISSDSLTAEDAKKHISKSSDGSEKKMSIAIIIVVFLAIAAIIVEYIVIFKPFKKKRNAGQRVYLQDQEDEEDTDDLAADDADIEDVENIGDTQETEHSEESEHSEETEPSDDVQDGGEVEDKDDDTEE